MAELRVGELIQSFTFLPFTNMASKCYCLAARRLLHDYFSEFLAVPQLATRDYQPFAACPCESPTNLFAHSP